MLNYYVGKTIPFQVYANGKTDVVQGKIIRSGYDPSSSTFSSNGPRYYGSSSDQSPTQPIVEVDGRLQFGLPGLPMFPALPDDSILKPALDWTLVTDKRGAFNAELAYVTGGMTWSAAYNVVAPETDNDTMDLVGWVTMDNESGKDFPDARIKLMAGDVNKIAPNTPNKDEIYAVESTNRLYVGASPVTKKAFDEYHLYTLQHPTTLRGHETKQAEFIHAEHIKYKQIYVYDGLQLDPKQYNGWP